MPAIVLPDGIGWKGWMSESTLAAQKVGRKKQGAAHAGARLA